MNDVELDQLLASIDDESVSAPNEQLTGDAGTERRAVLRYLVRSVYGDRSPNRTIVLCLVDELRRGSHTESTRFQRGRQ
jgi:hypothetical protein